MLVDYCLLLLLLGIFPSAQALFSNSTFFNWGDFSNNFATDLLPLLALFGENPTKQFLSESTSFLDSVLFGIGPLGILTTVVSVIRLYGNASLKSIIGRSQEPRGVAESELCSSTSADVCELWSHGGISRVFGRPKILAFIFTRQNAEFYPKDMRRRDDPPLCGINTPLNSLSQLKVGSVLDSDPEQKGYHADKCWQEESTKVMQVATSSSENSSKFAPVPNMTLNIGMRPISTPLKIFITTISLALEVGFLVFAYWATYRHLAFYNSEEGQSPTTWALVLTSVGTVLLNFGMGLCAWLVDEKSCERSFARKDGDGRVFWLQPGGQRAGEQLFNAFAYNDTSTKARYITSWRVEGPTSFAGLMTANIAVFVTMLGWAMQFVGLRGVPDAIALSFLVMTLIMAFVRAVIRSTRLGENKNDLHDLNQDVEGHELDWQSISLIQSATKLDDMRWWRFNDDYSDQDLSNDQNLHEDQRIWKAASGIDARQWIIEKENLGVNSGSSGAKAMRIRARFAYLTSEPAVDRDQAWSTKAREMASRLQSAFETSADYIFSHFPLQEGWRDASEFAWSTTCLRHDGKRDSICFYMNKDDQGGWSTDIHQLEAALGLWSWSLATEAIENRKWPKSIIVPEAHTSDMEAAINSWVTGSPEQLHSSLRSKAPTVLAVEAANIENFPLASPLRSTQLSLRTRNSPLQLMAQDLFTVFMSRIATIMDPLEEVAPKEPTSADLFGVKTQRYLGLTNPHLEVVADFLVSAGVASRKEAFMSVVPVLALKKRLPDINSVAEALLARARSLRRDGQLQASEALLDGLFFLGPLTMRNRALRQLGQIYRAEMRSEDGQKGRTGVSGLVTSPRTLLYDERLRKLEGQVRSMRSKLDIFKGTTGQGSLKDAQDEEKAAEETVQLYESMLERLRVEHGQEPFPNGAETSSMAQRAKFLTLKEDFALAERKEEELLDILKAAIKYDLPELVEDLWSVRPSLIEKAVRLDKHFDTKGLPEEFVENNLLDAPSPLWWAIQSTHHQETLESLVEWPGVRIEQINNRQQTALFLAAHENNPHAARLLLQKGAVWNTRDTDGNTPLLVAAGAGNDDTVHRLLDRGAGNEVSVMEGSLRESVVKRHRAAADGILQFARRHHDQVRLKSSLGKLVLSVVISECRSSSFELLEDWVSWLVTNGADINAECFLDSADTKAVHGSLERYNLNDKARDWKAYKWTALSAAVLGADRPELFKFLVDELGADVHTQTDLGNVLMLAIACRIEHAKYLVEECHADVKRPGREGHFGNALVMILCNNHDGKDRPKFGHASIEWGSILEYVLSHYQAAEIDEQVEYGLYGNALVAAAASGNPENVQTLLHKYPNIAINAQLLHGDYGSALVAAAIEGPIETMAMLLSTSTGDVNMKVKNGKFEGALHAAVMRAPQTSIQWLVDNGADSNAHLDRGKHESILAAAAYMRRVNAVLLLLAQQGRLNADQRRKAIEAARSQLSEADATARARFMGLEGRMQDMDTAAMDIIFLLEESLRTVGKEESASLKDHEPGAQDAT